MKLNQILPLSEALTRKTSTPEKSRKSDDFLSYLQDYMDRRLGYGNPHADVWFVGMEEAGDGSMKDTHRRIMSWERRGRPIYDDMLQHHNLINPAKHKKIENDKKLPRTTLRTVHILHAIHGKKVDNDGAKKYYRNKFATFDGEVCSIDLMPLAKPSINRWDYDKYTDHPDLQNPKDYYRIYKERRTHFIRSELKKYQPKIVVFYGLSYVDDWSKIAGTQLRPQKVDGKSIYVSSNGSTTFIAMPHVMSHGITNAFLYKVGSMAREQIF